MAFLIVFLWLASGAASFIYWYTKEMDLKIGDILNYGILWIFGPFVFLLGWFIYTDCNIFKRVLIEKRKR